MSTNALVIIQLKTNPLCPRGKEVHPLINEDTSTAKLEFKFSSSLSIAAEMSTECKHSISVISPLEQLLKRSPLCVWNLKGKGSTRSAEESQGGTVTESCGVLQSGHGRTGRSTSQISRKLIPSSSHSALRSWLPHSMWDFAFFKLVQVWASVSEADVTSGFVYAKLNEYLQTGRIIFILTNVDASLWGAFRLRWISFRPEKRKRIEMQMGWGGITERVFTPQEASVLMDEILVTVFL